MQRTQPGQSVAIRASSLHDGSTFQPWDDCTVVAREGVVVAVGPTSVIQRRYPDAVVQDVRPGLVTPGMIDMHTHTTMPGDGSSIEDVAPQPASVRREIAQSNLNAHLLGGVTTVRDLGSSLDLLDWVPDLNGITPRLVCYGPPITADQGHMHLFGGGLGDGMGIRELAERNLKAGAKGLKLVASGGGTLGTVPHEATLTYEQIREAVRFGHAAGLPVTVHALAVEAIDDAISAGVDSIEHLGFLREDGQSSIPDDTLTRALAAGVAFGSTTTCNEAFLHTNHHDHPADHKEQEERSDYYQRNAQALLRRNVTLTIGTDAGWKHTPFGRYVRELRVVHEAGMGVEALIRQATAGNSEALAIPGLTGQLRRGHEADLVVWPDMDLNSDDLPPWLVMRSGVVVGGRSS